MMQIEITQETSFEDAQFTGFDLLCCVVKLQAVVNCFVERAGISIENEDVWLPSFVLSDERYILASIECFLLSDSQRGEQRSFGRPMRFHCQMGIVALMMCLDCAYAKEREDENDTSIYLPTRRNIRRTCTVTAALSCLIASIFGNAETTFLLWAATVIFFYRRCGEKWFWVRFYSAQSATTAVKSYNRSFSLHMSACLGLRPGDTRAHRSNTRLCEKDAEGEGVSFSPRLFFWPVLFHTWWLQKQTKL